MRRIGQRSSRRAVLDRHEPVRGRSRIGHVGGRDPHVVSGDTAIASQVRIADVGPALDVGVPCVGGFAQVDCERSFVSRDRKIRGGEQRGDFDRQREGRITRLLFPAVLLGHGSVARKVTRGATNHRPGIEVGKIARAPERVGKQDRKAGLVELNPTPIRRAIDPHVLRPVPIGFLGGHEIDQCLARAFGFAGGEQSASAFDEVAWPDQVIAAQVVVAFIESPRNRETRDHRSVEALGLVRLQHGGRDPVEIEPGVVDFAEVQAPPLKVFPLPHVVGHMRGERLQQRGACVVTGLRVVAAEAQREHQAVVAASEVKLGGECDVAVGCLGEAPSKLPVRGQILPAVAGPDIAAAHGAKGHRAGERQRRAVTLREKHRHALPLADPGAVAVAEVVDVRRQQREDRVIGHLAPQRLKMDGLQENIALCIGEDGLDDAITASQAIARDAITRHALSERGYPRTRVSLLLREEILAVGNDEAQVARVGLIQSRKINFVDDAVREREPDATLRVDRSPHAAFRA